MRKVRGQRSREAEDAVVSRISLLALAHASGISMATFGGAATRLDGATGFWQLGADDSGGADGPGVADEELEHVFVAHGAAST